MTQSLHPARIAVVSGGRSTERERSLMSGRAALESLDRQGYTTVFLDAASKDFSDQVRSSDVAFLAIAGQYAEDGKLQGLLETLNIPYTGSGVTASAVGMHKTLAKTIVAAAGVTVLPSAHVPAHDRDTITRALTDAVAFRGTAHPGGTHRRRQAPPGRAVRRHRHLGGAPARLRQPGGVRLRRRRVDPGHRGAQASAPPRTAEGPHHLLGFLAARDVGPGGLRRPGPGDLRGPEAGGGTGKSSVSRGPGQRRRRARRRNASPRRGAQTADRRPRRRAACSPSRPRTCG